MEDVPHTLQNLLEIQDLGQFSDDSALRLIGTLIDLAAASCAPDATQHAIKLSGELGSRKLSNRTKALLQYFTGTAWFDLSRHGAWEWDQAELSEAILHYRLALASSALSETQRCKAATNIGNAMSRVGRSIDALRYYELAMQINPDFGMAIGNRGIALLAYARNMYDRGHQEVASAFAINYLNRALDLPLEGSARRGFQRYAQIARSRAAAPERVTSKRLNRFSLGGGKERHFRRWLLREGLYLNPLNDLGPFNVAARDILHLPTMVVSTGHGVGFHGYFNQLKQELASARLLTYEAIHLPRTFADNDTVLLDTRDGAEFGIALERCKLAFSRLLRKAS